MQTARKHRFKPGARFQPIAGKHVHHRSPIDEPGIIAPDAVVVKYKTAPKFAAVVAGMLELNRRREKQDVVARS